MEMWKGVLCKGCYRRAAFTKGSLAAQFFTKRERSTFDACG